MLKNKGEYEMTNNPFQYHADRNISFAIASMLNMDMKIIQKDRENKFQALRAVHNLTAKEAKEAFKFFQVVKLTEWA